MGQVPSIEHVSQVGVHYSDNLFLFMAHKFHKYEILGGEPNGINFFVFGEYTLMNPMLLAWHVYQTVS